MANLLHAAANFCANAMAQAVGRSNSIRIAKSLHSHLRLFGKNQFDVNGESLLCNNVICQTRPNDLVVFDVGANVGDWSRMLLAMASGRRIDLHLFEPSSSTFDALLTLKQVTAAQGVSAMFNQLALGREVGTRNLHSVAPLSGQNSIVMARGRGGDDEVEPVLVTSLDKYCADKGIGRIDLLKIDAEGSDMDVLLGGGSMFASCAVRVAQFEYNQCWIDGRSYLRDAFDFFESHRYSIGRLCGRGIVDCPKWSVNEEDFMESNWVAISPTFTVGLPRLSF